MKLRHLVVSAVEPLSPTMVRITVAGDDLRDFRSLGPADHVKVFFPDADGVMTTPIFTEAGVSRPEEGTIIARDYTPLAARPEVGELDLDFVLHGPDGPASRWAANAKVGDSIVIGGPRGSHLPPEDADGVALIADETGLPAVKRWIEMLGDQTPVKALLFVDDAELTEYLAPQDNVELRWFQGSQRQAELEEALRAMEFGPQSFVFLAGEANSIAVFRRYLRRELGLNKEQVDAHGYWKQGITNLDHHAPVDPSDPD